MKKPEPCEVGRRRQLGEIDVPDVAVVQGRIGVVGAESGGLHAVDVVGEADAEPLQPQAGETATVVGQVEAEPGLRFGTPDGGAWTPAAAGYQHFDGGHA